MSTGRWIPLGSRARRWIRVGGVGGVTWSDARDAGFAAGVVG